MGKNRPKPSRPPGRRGRGGIGPGPGYKPNPNTGGTRHKSSSVEGSPIIRVVWAVAAIAVLLIGSPIVYLLHGYGVI